MVRLNQLYGVDAAVWPTLPAPIQAQRAPVSGQDINYPQGQPWFDNSQTPPVGYTFVGGTTNAWESNAASLTAPGPIGSVTPSTGAFTTLTSTGATTLASGAGVAAKLGNSTGTLGFFGGTGTTKATQAALTNSVTAGGTTGTIANYTDLTVYANDSNAIRNDIYQLSLALSNVITALRAYGLFT